MSVEEMVYSRPRAVAESARGLDAIAECDSILPGYQSIARRAAIALRGVAADNAKLRSALRDLRKWGSQCPYSAEEEAAHRQAGYAAFDKAREAMRRGRRPSRCPHDRPALPAQLSRVAGRL